MDLSKLTYTDTRSALNAANEALELLCRLRGIPLDSLSDAELGAYFFASCTSVGPEGPKAGFQASNSVT